jgi:hypothetical protein
MKSVSRLKCLVTICLGAIAGQAISATYESVGCSNQEASANLGACASSIVTCSSSEQQASCVNTTLDYYFVKQDFPTSCPTKVNSNCHEPLANCYRKTTCVWTGGKCQPDDQSTNANLWTQKTKRTSDGCSGGPGDPQP